MEKMNVKPAEGKLGVLCVGLGAVATTFMTGVLMTRKGLAKPVGSMTQYDKIRVGRGEAKKYLHYNEIVPMAKLDDIVLVHGMCIRPMRMNRLSTVKCCVKRILIR